MFGLKKKIEKVSCAVVDHDWDRDGGDPCIWERKCKRCGKEQTRRVTNVSHHSQNSWRDK